MAKQGKVRPARRPRGKESLLIRSTESIGRVIGSLQRQIDESIARDERIDGDGAARSTGTLRRTAADRRAAAKK